MAATPTTGEPLLGDNRPGTSASSQEFFIRPSRASDIYTLGQICTRAYWLSPMNRFLAPRAEQYLDDLPRQFRQSLRQRMCLANVLFITACKTAEPDTIVGYGLFTRLGNDAGARQFVASKGLLQRWWMWILSWLFWAYDSIDLLIWKPRAFDRNAAKLFGEWIAVDTEKHWKSHPERANRWFANNVVVHPDYQGKGIGKMLMADAMEKAQAERVIMGLSASPHGEFLYRKLGFEMLGDFSHRPDTEGPGDKGGGIMIWYPEGYEGIRHTD